MKKRAIVLGFYLKFTVSYRLIVGQIDEFAKNIYIFGKQCLKINSTI